MKPFEFQTEIIQQTYRAIDGGILKPCIVAPCGAGKTFIASQILQDYTINKPNPTRCCFLVDRTVLLDQTAKELKGFGVRSTVLQGKRRLDHSADTVIASIQSITSKLQQGKTVGEVLGELGLLIFDECHISAFSKTAQAIISHYSGLQVPIVGLTGSPWRLSKKQWLGQLFDCAITAPQPPELVRIGRIVPARCFTLGGVIDVSQLDVGRDGDFSESQMEDQAIGRIALETVVAEYKRLGENRLAAAYCSGVKHAELLAEEFNRQGVAAEWQSAATPLGKDGKDDHKEGRNTRAAQSYRLSQGITRVICSVDTLSTGWNVPQCKLILMVRATQSRSLFIQAANRGSRYCPESGFNDYLLLDFGENVKRFGGSPTGFQDYSIDQPPQRKKQDGDKAEPRTKTCYNCHAEINTRLRVCPYCGINFDIDEDFQTGAFDEIELAEYFDDTGIEQVRFLRQAKKDAYSAGENPDLVDQKFRERFGFLAPKDWHYAAILGRNPSMGQKLTYERYLKQFNLNRYWLQHHLQLELGTKGQPAIFVDRKPYWEVLEVSEGSDWEECLQSYLKLAELSPNVERLNEALDQAKLELKDQKQWQQLQLIA